MHTVAGFHENLATNTVGRLTKDKMYVDFRFDFTAKVAGRGVSGYLWMFFQQAIVIMMQETLYVHWMMLLENVLTL